MFEKDDSKYLIRQLSSNQVVLFLGSGFSYDCKNKIGEDFPLGAKLGSKIWDFLKYDGDYETDGTKLPEMYQAFLSAGIKKQDKIEFLENNLLSSHIPDFYQYLALPYWFKIYTTNIDDIVPKTYKNLGRHVQELVFPQDQYAERDQSLENTQLIYLHGKLPCSPDEVIFSPQQYAKAQLTYEPLYGQFVYDYATLPTIFIGTELNEPLFERYLVAREGRFGQKERRPKSYLISPNLSPVKADILKASYNVHYIKGTSRDFLDWLNSIKDELPTRTEILKNTFPNLLEFSEYAEISGVSKKSILDFARSFKRVPREISPKKVRSGFLSGASPRWNDIVCDLDIPRTITSSLKTKIEEHVDQKGLKNEKVQVHCLTGYAGSGKSTILKRLGITLTQSGRTVFLTYSDYLPRTNVVVNLLSAIDERVILMFDNSKNVMSQIPRLIQEFNQQLKYPPVIVLAIRSNHTNLFEYHVTPDIADIHSIAIPNLDDNEIDYLIQKLEENNLLGQLTGLSSGLRIREIKRRAHRQILIAMKEATNGRSFNDIIEDEFNSLVPYEAKILALCIALNTELGFPNSKQDLVGFSKLSHIETLGLLDTILQGTTIEVGNNGKFMLRHRILADYIINYFAEPIMLKEAYIRVLSVLAPELIDSKGNSGIFNLYKSLINHKILYRRFKGDLNMAREVFDSITTFFRSDAHFWLQYGSLEVEGKGGDLSLAENYIAQAESLSPNSNYVKTAKCNLLYKQATAAKTLHEAKEIKGQADELAQRLLLSIGKEESIPFVISCVGRYKYTSKWTTETLQKKSELKEIKDITNSGITFHPFNKKLQEVLETVNRAYIQQGVDIELEDPEFPDYLNQK